MLIVAGKSAWKKQYICLICTEFTSPWRQYAILVRWGRSVRRPCQLQCVLTAIEPAHPPLVLGRNRPLVPRGIAEFLTPKYLLASASNKITLPHFTESQQKFQYPSWGTGKKNCRENLCLVPLQTSPSSPKIYVWMNTVSSAYFKDGCISSLKGG